MTQALPSLVSELSAANEIRSVSGPPDLVKTVNSQAITTHPRWLSRAPVSDARPGPACTAGLPRGSPSNHLVCQLVISGLSGFFILPSVVGHDAQLCDAVAERDCEHVDNARLADEIVPFVLRHARPRATENDICSSRRG